MFILSDQRDEDVVNSFRSYMEYLKENENRFPKKAYALATSDWYFGFDDHRCPHDSWPVRVVIEETGQTSSEDDRAVSISIVLRGAYHDGHIHITYPKVYEYRLGISVDSPNGHGDWRYDEFRIDEHGRLIHEIEFRDFEERGTWIIVSDDIEYSWVPSGT